MRHTIQFIAVLLVIQLTITLIWIGITKGLDKRLNHVLFTELT
ncbi:Uncharacterised protein [Vibrio cholerae]|nr:Uncharacterised protein [Vibrio cholerae]